MNVVATVDTFEESGVLTQENLTFLALYIYVVALQAWSRMCSNAAVRRLPGYPACIFTPI